MRQTFISALAATALFTTTPAFAQELTLEAYLTSMDRRPVTFSGRIKYDSSDEDFSFYDSNKEWFDVTMDAGRESRERVEEECENSGFMISNLCQIEGRGTVEIRGSRILLSIEEITSLKQEK